MCESQGAYRPGFLADLLTFEIVVTLAVAREEHDFIRDICGCISVQGPDVLREASPWSRVCRRGVGRVFARRERKEWLGDELATGQLCGNGGTVVKVSLGHAECPFTHDFEYERRVVCESEVVRGA